ncbi:MAG: methyltransferase [Bacteroidales bacterium]|nr:methyltransferase [Bacteroidales bacterium]MDD4639744.1 methyltransferase [Bacteroidales bacterium]
MSSDSFRFKQFEVFHDRCAMKVGMDGVLLGAWAKCSAELPEIAGLRMLDVGSGSGLIALMLAQRYPSALIFGIEKDIQAALQAQENVASSPWSERIQIIQGSFPESINYNFISEEQHFDLIVSNPPYYRNALKAGNFTRNLARHGDKLSFEQLTMSAAGLLSEKGVFAVIVPAEAAELMEELCWGHRLYLTEICQVAHRKGKNTKRTMMAFTKNRLDISRQELQIETSKGEYTPEFKALTTEFYL